MRPIWFSPRLPNILCRWELAYPLPDHNCNCEKKKSTGKTHVSLCANLNISLQMCGIQIITKKQKRKTMHMVCTHAIRRTCCLLSFPRLLYRPMLDREYTLQALCVPASFGQIPRSIVLEVMAVSLLPHPLVPLQLQLPIRPLIFLLEANKAFHHLRSRMFQSMIHRRLSPVSKN